MIQQHTLNSKWFFLCKWLRSHQMIWRYSITVMQSIVKFCMTPKKNFKTNFKQNCYLHCFWIVWIITKFWKSHVEFLRKNHTSYSKRMYFSQRKFKCPKIHRKKQRGLCSREVRSHMVSHDVQRCFIWRTEIGETHLCSHWSISRAIVWQPLFDHWLVFPQ